MFGYISCDDSFVALNSAWENTLGFTLPELQRQQWDMLIHPEDRRETLAAIEKVKNGERENITFENRFESKDGSYKWLRWQGDKAFRRTTSLLYHHQGHHSTEAVGSEVEGR